jgi:uncharacterized protein
MAHPLLNPLIVEAVEKAATEHRGRTRAHSAFTDLNHRATHPCGIFSGAPFSVFAKLDASPIGEDQFAAELCGFGLIRSLPTVATLPSRVGLAQPAGGRSGFCRVTQMGLLRRSNPAIMGDDSLDRSQAGRLFDQLRSDERVLWAEEPDELDAVWRAISARDDKSQKLWTDDYLAAFAQVGDLTLATLDRKLPSRYPSVRVESLLP